MAYFEPFCPQSRSERATAWSLVEGFVTMLVGAWLYRESDFPAIS
ncbi:MAG TPA: hypothetical protein VGB47_12105 [Thermoanaerobaculia bacterium]|jgi:hypothetical protein